MSALTFRKAGDMAQYRDATFRQASMPGVTTPSFRCAGCGEIKTTAGRKAVVPGYSKAGWHCRDCAAPAELVAA